MKILKSAQTTIHTHEQEQILSCMNNSFLTLLHEEEKEQLILTRVDLELCIISTVSLA